MGYDFSNIAYLTDKNGNEIKQIKQGTTTIWTKPYTWAKYNIKEVTTTKNIYTAEVFEKSPSGTTDSKYEWCTGFEIDPIILYKNYIITENGIFQGSGRSKTVNYIPELINEYDNGYIYVIEDDGEVLFKYTSMGLPTADSIEQYYKLKYKYKKYKIVEDQTTITETIKTNFVSNVSSSSSNTYPTDGIQNNYWYILFASPSIPGFNQPVITPSVSTYSVENVSGATYGFELSTSNPNWYYSTNDGIDNSYSICKINIVSNGKDRLIIKCYNSAEKYCDYGILSNLDTELTLSYEVDNDSNIKHKCYDHGEVEEDIDYGVLTAGNHFIYIKYRKDVSRSEASDLFMFKVTFE